jgi:hypothetical protein
MGPTALLSSEKSRATDCVVLKNPSSSALFEPANLGSNGKHAKHYTTEGGSRVHARPRTMDFKRDKNL